MKKFMGICMVCLMAILCMVACNTHKHTFSDEWEHDDTYHWHAATCEHTDEVGAKGKHIFVENTCKTCGYKRTEKPDDPTDPTDPNKPHVHDEKLVEVAGKDPTCTETGLKAHLKCNSCGALFDKDTGEEVKYESLVLDAKGHKLPLKVHEAVEATCVEGGNVKYYECEDCKTLFSDENAETPTDLKQVATEPDPTKHSLSHVDAVEGNCVTHAKRAYDECELCEKKFDEEGNVLTDSEIDLGVDLTRHVGTIEFVPTQSPTCSDVGVAAHYACTECRRPFSDPEGKVVIEDESNLRISPYGHDFSAYESVDEQYHRRVCSECGEPETNDDGEILSPHSGSLYCVVCGHSRTGELPPTANAIVNGISYSCNTETKEATVQKTMGLTNNDGTVIVGGTLKFGGIDFTVNEIADSAFARQTLSFNLKKVIIRDTVTSIGSRAFQGHTQLKTIVIGYNSELQVASDAFSGCGTDFKEVYFHGTKSEFEELTNLKSALPSGGYVRYYSENRPSENFTNYWHYDDYYERTPAPYTSEFYQIDYSNRIKYKCEENKTATAVELVAGANRSTVIIPDYVYVDETPYAVTVINDKLFRNNSELTTLTIGDNVTNIRNNAFEGCSELVSVTLGKSLTNLAKEAFRDCSSLTSIEIPDSVTSIGESAFRNCTSLQYVKIGSGVTTIGRDAFGGCTSLISIEVSEDNPTYRSAGNCIVEKRSGAVILGCKTSEIPSDAKSIGDSAFASCVDLVSITVPSNITSIGSNAFNGCTALTSIVLPSELTSIGSNAFGSCPSLTIYFLGSSSAWGSISANVGDVPCRFYSLDEPSDPEDELEYWHYGDDGEIVLW